MTSAHPSSLFLVPDPKPHQKPVRGACCPLPGGTCQRPCCRDPRFQQCLAEPGRDWSPEGVCCCGGPVAGHGARRMRASVPRRAVPRPWGLVSLWRSLSIGWFPGFPPPGGGGHPPTPCPGGAPGEGREDSRAAGRGKSAPVSLLLEARGWACWGPRPGHLHLQNSKNIRIS